MADLMEYKGYHAKVEYDPDDKLLVGKVFGISDSLNFHAKDVDELEEAFHTSIDGYLKLENVQKKNIVEPLMSGYRRNFISKPHCELKKMVWL